MIVKFRVTSTDDGLAGLQDAMKAIMQAPAGAPLPNPNTSTVQYWEVIDNTVAGGWTLIAEDTTPSWNSSQRVFTFTAPTPKTATHPKGQKKGISFYTYYNSSWSYNAGYFQAHQVADDNTIGTSTNLTNRTGGNSSYQYPSFWSTMQGSIELNDYYITVCATEEYCWVLVDGISVTTKKPIVGISDLTSATEWDYDVGSAHFPVGGIICDSTNSSTTGDWSYDQYNILAYGINNQDESYGKTFGEVVNWQANYSIRVASGAAQNYTIPLGPTFIDTPGTTAVGTTNYRKGGWDSSAFDRNTLQDVTFMSPNAGWNSRSVKGLKLVGWNRYYNQYNTGALHGKIIQSGNDKYLMHDIGTCVWAVQIN